MTNVDKFTLSIVIFMLAGILSGTVIHSRASPGVVTAWADNITLLTDISLRLIKMVIVPLVLSTPTVGTIRLRGTSTIGRVGGKVILWFISSSMLSILVGLLVVSLEQPSSGLNPAIPLGAIDTGLAVGGVNLKGLLTHTIPTSIAETMINNETLQIVAFSTFFGTGGASFGEKLSTPLVAALDVVPHIMLKMTGYATYVAPLAVFAAISSVISIQGLGILLNYTSSIDDYYMAILLTCLVLLATGYAILEKEVFRLVSMLKNPVPAAFTASSSEAAYPRTLEQLTKLGCPPNIVSFMLLIDYSFNLVGSMVYCSFVSMFIVRAYNIHLSFAETTALILTLILASKGIAGVPRSIPVMLAATIPSLNIPVAGILLLMGIDHFLDTGCSTINVLDNGVVTAMLTWNEGLLEEEQGLVEREA